MSIEAPESGRVDIDAYLHRIGYAGELRPTYAVLEDLHLGHSTHIPFENLDILLGRPIRLDLESLQAKLVNGNRGGYCFEHNLLFAAVLETVGFSVTPLAARVRFGTSRVLPRTHMALLVDIDKARSDRYAASYGDFGAAAPEAPSGPRRAKRAQRILANQPGALSGHQEQGPWLVDVGFGGEGLLRPVSLARAETPQFAWTYRVVEEQGRWLLQSRRDGDWNDLYAFTLEPQHQADYEMANYYTSTHPNSRFVQTLTVQLPGPDGRMILRNRELIIDTGVVSTSQLVTDDHALLEVLAERFGLRFPPGTRFPHFEQMV